MDNPYKATAYATTDIKNETPWWHCVLWALAIFVSANLFAFIAGLSMGHWEFYGATLEEAIQRMRFIRRVGYFLIGATLYWAALRGVRRNRVLYLALTFAIAQFVDICVALTVFGTPTAELFEAGPFLRSLAAAVVGGSLAWLTNRGRPESLPTAKPAP